MSFLNSMKSRLGFGGDEYDDEVDDYDDRYDDGYDDDYDDEYDDDYDDAPYDSGRGSAGGYDPYESSSRDTRVRYVDRGEAAARSRAERYGASSYRSSSFGTRSGNTTLSALQSTAEADDFRTGSGSSEPEFMRNRSSEGVGHRSVVSLSDERTRRDSGRDAFDEYLDSPRAVTQVAHSCELISPLTYAEAEKIAIAYKSGTNVALVLKNTRPELAKRILDFSFGVVSALGGSVERVYDKVFMLSHSSGGITAAEQQQLRDAGIIQ